MLFQLTAGISAYGAELQEEETEVTDSYETDEARQEPPELSETLPDNSENAEDEIDDTPENTGEEESISELPDSVPETSVPETVQETGNNTPRMKVHLLRAFHRNSLILSLQQKIQWREKM